MPTLLMKRCTSWRHFSKCSSQVSGATKYSISICSNSRERKIKSRGAISLRKALPICANPNGSLGCSESTTFLKLTNMPPAGAGRGGGGGPAGAPGGGGGGGGGGR